MNLHSRNLTFAIIYTKHFFVGIKMYAQKLLSHIKTEITLAQTSNISNIPEHRLLRPRSKLIIPPKMILFIKI